MKKSLLGVFIIFVVIFGLGFSFMQYEMFNPTINLFAIIIGGIGICILGIKIYKK